MTSCPPCCWQVEANLQCKVDAGLRELQVPGTEAPEWGWTDEGRNKWGFVSSGFDVPLMVSDGGDGGGGKVGWLLVPTPGGGGGR